ncbi:MAG: alpha/beta fold hydrolase [Atopostipes suicloacalis]|nr:alpha/beta fold hydrolase [Atopostipes suicloacalis]
MNHYEKRGPKAVILFHAYTSSALDVVSLGRSLARQDYTVYMPNLSGHGLEDPEKILDYGIEDWKKDGEAAYQKLIDDGYENISVFGLSLGGVVATHLMLNKKVTTYGAFSSPLMPNQKTNIRRYFWKLYQTKKKEMGEAEEVINEDYPMVMEKLDQIFSELNDYVIEMAKHYSEVKLPIFLGQGRLDEMIESTETEKLAKEFKNAEVEFHCYKKAPHVITTGKAGQALKKDLSAFLEKNV